MISCLGWNFFFSNAKCLGLISKIKEYICILISPIFFLCQDSEEDSSFKVTIEEIPPKNLLNDLQKNSKSPTRRKNSARDKIDGDDPKCSSRNRITPFLLDIASKGNILIS